MRNWSGYGCVWLVGIVDYALTSLMIEDAGLSSEANPIIRWAVATFGAQVMLLIKIGSLSLFTSCIVVVGRRNREAATRGLTIGVSVSTLLSTWWAVTMFTLPLGQA